MRAEETIPRSRRIRWKKRGWTVLLVGLGLSASVTLFHDALATWGVRQWLSWQGLDAHVEAVHIGFKNRSVTLVQPSWNQDGQDGMAVAADTVTAKNIRWVQDSLSLSNLAIAGLRFNLKDWTVSSDSSASGSWQETWPEALAAVVLQSVTWDDIRVTLDTSTHVWMGHGGLSGVAMDARGVDLPALDVSGAMAIFPGWTDTLVIQGTHLSATWGPEAWSVKSQHLNLPGLHFEGDLAWPSMTGHGALDVRWSELQPWAQAFLPANALSDWGLVGGQTAATWDLDSTRWHVQATGPEGLQATAMGDTDTWAMTVDVAATPPVLRDIVGTSNLELRAESRLGMVNWQASGEPDLNVRGDFSMIGNWRNIVDRSSHRWSANVQVHAWPGWILGDEDQLRARVEATPGQMTVHARQDSAQVPWSIQASWVETHLDVQASLPRLSFAAGEFISVQGWGRLQANDRYDAGSWNLHAALEGDTVLCKGRVDASAHPIRWQAQLQGAGLNFQAIGTDSPALWVEATTQAARRLPTKWPRLDASGSLGPDNALTRHLLSSITLKDSAFVDIQSSSKGLNAQAQLSRWKAGEWDLDSTHVTVQGLPNSLYVNLLAESPDTRPAGMPAMVSLDVHADTSWFANLSADMGQGNVSEWALEGTPGPSPGAPWHWVAHQGEIPLGLDRLVLAETPLTWSAPFQAPLPSFWRLQSEHGSLVFQSQTLRDGALSIGCYGTFKQLDDWLALLDTNLHARQLALQGKVTWGGREDLEASLDANLDDVAYEAISFPSVFSTLRWTGGMLHTTVEATHPENGCTVSARGFLQPSSQTTPRATIQANHVPLPWLQPWVDPSVAQLDGELDVDLRVAGLLSSPRLEGTGTLRNAHAFVPSLGTSFGGNGRLDIQPDGMVLQDFQVSDVRGVSTRVEGALMHDAFSDWNLDVSIVDAQENLVIMDLPASPGAPVYGSLHGRGTVDVFFWNNQVSLEGDVVADAPTQFSISLVTESDDGWDELVQFKKPVVAGLPEESEAEDELSVLFKLNIEALPAAQVTVVMDEENNGNIVGHTQGNIQFELEDWERMTLKGELEVVEGQYDFALGPFLRKSFVARKGGTLSWGGDPYEGTLELDAVYTTRANVAPLIGASANGGPRNETIDVVLHLSGPMLAPNISFDLEAPNADRLVAEALSSALADENDRTNQAIALLSLQEFLPNSFNTLELGANGLQEYSIDMITSQLSRWLSRINDDVEVGISYDPNNSFDPSATGNQNALQLALKASFLEDKLEVEGSLGSSAITQEALGEARLQNIRVMYHLNEEKGLDLTGFSESQTSATQSANSTSQGVGIRWHRSFNWTWPWRHKETED